MSDTPSDHPEQASPQQIELAGEAADNDPLRGVDPALIEQANRRYLYAPVDAPLLHPEVTTDEPKPGSDDSTILHYLIEGACCVPIIGNIICLKDVAFDTYVLCKTDERGLHANLKNLWLWVTLAIDAIGLVPAAGNASAPIRLAIRHGIWEFAKGPALPCWSTSWSRCSTARSNSF